jgi:uncharacterized membrane protein YebE (DUF533 family)
MCPCHKDFVCGYCRRNRYERSSQYLNDLAHQLRGAQTNVEMLQKQIEKANQRKF